MRSPLIEERSSAGIIINKILCLMKAINTVSGSCLHCEKNAHVSEMLSYAPQRDAYLTEREEQDINTHGHAKYGLIVRV